MSAVSGLPYEAEVADYLACCAAAEWLNRRYHPTAEGAVKLIRHAVAGDVAETRRRASQIRETFNALKGQENDDPEHGLRDLRRAPRMARQGPQAEVLL